MATPAVGGSHAVPNVAADVEQEVAERMPDRGAANNRTVDDRDEVGHRDVAVGEILAAGVAVDPRDVVSPGLAGLQVEQELEAVGSEFQVREQRGILDIEAEGPKEENHCTMVPGSSTDLLPRPVATLRMQRLQHQQVVLDDRDHAALFAVEEPALPSDVCKATRSRSG